MRSRNIFFYLLVLLMGCIDPIPLQNIQYDKMLVVEGYVSADLQPHTVRLSYSSPLTDQAVIPVTGALVTVTDDQSNTYTYTEAKPGVYNSIPFAGIIGNKYTLHLEINGKQYESEQATLLDSPPIGQIYLRYPSPEPNADLGIQVYLDTPDPDRKTSYYRWEFIDTYEIQMPKVSRFQWFGGNDVNIRELPVDRCWHTDSSKVILLADKSNFSNTGVTEYPIRFLPYDGRQLAVKYSILVKQYPLSRQMYEFWNQLRKTNQTQGSLFDIQPGTVNGNVRSTSDPNETVLGYFDAGAMKSMRVFFRPVELEAAGFIPVDYYGICESIQPAFVPFNKIGEYMTINQRTQDIVDANADENGPYYIIYPKTCCNCTRDGSNVMPDFWQ